MLFPPFRSQFTGEGFMQNSSFTGFKAIHHGLCLFLGLIQLGEQTFDFSYNTPLFIQLRQHNPRGLKWLKRYMHHPRTVSFCIKLIHNI